jgi:hypothetical protein
VVPFLWQWWRRRSKVAPEATEATDVITVTLPSSRFDWARKLIHVTLHVRRQVNAQPMRSYLTGQVRKEYVLVAFQLHEIAVCVPVRLMRVADLLLGQHHCLWLLCDLRLLPGK